MIKTTRNKLGPGAAKHFVQTMRGLYQWAMELGHVDDDPTQGVRVPRPATGGFRTWTEDEILAYVGRWPVGTVPCPSCTTIEVKGEDDDA